MWYTLQFVINDAQVGLQSPPVDNRDHKH